MSMLGTLGGSFSGLGGGGGMGSSPGDMAASTAAATATINPSVTLGRVGGGYVTVGPFAPMFPGVEAQPVDAINRAPLASFLGLSGNTLVYVLLAVGIVVVALFLRK